MRDIAEDALRPVDVSIYEGGPYYEKVAIPTTDIKLLPEATKFQQYLRLWNLIS